MTTRKQNDDPDYGAFELEAVRFDVFEAWWFPDNEWIPLEAAKTRSKLSVLTKELYVEIFGELPVLPPEAFQVKVIDPGETFLGHPLFDPQNALLSAKNKPVKFAELDAVPVVWMPSGDAWCYAAPTPCTAPDFFRVWRRLNTAEANVKARLLDKATFDERFPKLAPMPAEADSLQAETFQDPMEYTTIMAADGPMPTCYFENEPSPFPTYRRMFSPERNAEFDALREQQVAALKQHQDAKRGTKKAL
jgi:hypothetical protein